MSAAEWLVVAFIAYVLTVCLAAFVGAAFDLALGWFADAPDLEDVA